MSRYEEERCRFTPVYACLPLERRLKENEDRFICAARHPLND